VLAEEGGEVAEEGVVAVGAVNFAVLFHAGNQ
jgi:hypothetical protein